MWNSNGRFSVWWLHNNRFKNATEEYDGSSLDWWWKFRNSKKMF
jgi:hypothetical protein